ncbi:colicin-N, partial [Salmonella enterica]|nr:colicin-N [Salmonella enterica]
PGKDGPASTIGPDGKVHINITGGMERDKSKPTGNGGGKGSSGGNGQGQNNAAGGSEWSFDSASGTYSLPNNTKGLKNIRIDSVNSYTVVMTGFPSMPFKATAVNGDINNIKVDFSSKWRGPKDKRNRLVRDIVKQFIEFKRNDEKETLMKASEIITDMGEKVSEKLGEKYKSIAKDIANNIKNFQGRTVRSYPDAMKSVNKVLSNPGMKISKGDKDALVSAWKSVNASDLANKMGNLSRAFKVADVAMKVEKVREKSIIGYETGDWGPLILEVESWIVGGVAGSIAMSIFSATLGMALLTIGVPAVAVGIGGIIVAVTVAAMIDEKIVERLNNEVIRPAH